MWRPLATVRKFALYKSTVIVALALLGLCSADAPAQNMSYASMKHAVGIDYRGAWVSAPIRSADAAMIREENRSGAILAVYTSVGTDQHVFDDPTLFPKLRHASLCAPSVNRDNLRALSINYPQLRSLTIRQPQPLTGDDAQCIKAFSGLKLLELDCPVSNPTLLKDCLSHELEQVELVGTGIPTAGNSLPASLHLGNLTIMDDILSPKFFPNLDAPNLRHVWLVSTHLEPDSLKELNKFKRLTEIDLSGSPVRPEQYKALSDLKAKVIDNDGRYLRISR